jgi:hypothetical protein
MMKMPQLQVFEYFPPARRGIEADGGNCWQKSCAAVELKKE